MSSSPSTSPVYTIHREVKDAADSGDITNRDLGMNMHGFRTGDIRVVPSANSNPTVEVLFWSGEAGKFVSRVHAVETGGFGDGVAFDLPFKAFGGVAFVKVKGGVGSGDTVTITMAGAQRQAAESDVIAWFDQVNYTNGDDKRYFWDPINYVLHGPFDANEIAWGWIYGDRCVSVFEAVTETTGHTEDFSAWTTIGGASVTSDQITAPDKAKLADKLAFGAAAADGIKIVLGSATDNTNQTVTAWVRTLEGTKQFRFAFLRKDDSVITSGNLTAIAAWRRFDFTADILAGATAAEVRIINGSGAAAGDIYIWGGAVYKDSSFPRQYRTNETGADQLQAKDQVLWAAAVVPTEMRDIVAVNLVPAYADTEANIFNRILHFEDASEEIYYHLRSTGDVFVQEYGGDSTVYVQTAGAHTWSRDLLLTIQFRASEGKVITSGFSTNNGTYTGTAWATDDGNVHLGMRKDAIQQINGLISEPKKKAA